MERVNVELPYINKNIRWKIGVIITGNPSTRTPYEQIDITRKFEFRGELFTKVVPRFSVSIEIKKPKEENFSFENSVFIPGSFVYQFIRTLDDVIEGFQEKDLFYYDANKKLQVNKELSKRKEIRFPVGKNEIRFLYTVVADFESETSNESTEYEGLALIINSYTNFVYLTYDEICNMRDILKNTDFLNISLQSILVAKTTKVEG